MAYCVEKVEYNGYRCGCCSHESEYTTWVDSLEEALAEVPTEFPTEGSFGGCITVRVRDGTTGKHIAESRVDWPLGGPKGAVYSYTRWRLSITEPGHEREVVQIIAGTPSEKKELVPLDREWSDILEEVRERRRQQDIRRAEHQAEEAQRILANLRPSDEPLRSRPAKTVRSKGTRSE